MHPAPPPTFLVRGHEEPRNPLHVSQIKRARPGPMTRTIALDNAANEETMLYLIHAKNATPYAQSYYADLRGFVNRPALFDLFMHHFQAGAWRTVFWYGGHYYGARITAALVPVYMARGGPVEGVDCDTIHETSAFEAVITSFGGPRLHIGMWIPPREPAPLLLLCLRHANLNRGLLPQILDDLLPPELANRVNIYPVKLYQPGDDRRKKERLTPLASFKG